MKNILIRSGISPLDTFDPAYMLIKNSIGGNVGNLIYAYSVYRTLMTENTNIVPDYYRINEQDADKINKTYDYYIIPLADAFRQNFIPHLRKYTKLIKKLTIPVIVIGVGLRAPFEPKLGEGFPFDKDVIAFVNAVLDKSAMIGVRGEITAQYLNRLGFREEIDHTVIGCPSMYTFGKALEIRNTNITKDSLICFNSSMLSPKNVLDFITRGMKEFPNHYFIPQWLKEMKLVFSGTPSLNEKADNYPAKMSHPVYANNRVRFFLNAATWIDFMRRIDLSFGARLHGNVTATIAGTPSIIIPKDARMRELAEHHNLTRVWWNDITEDTFLEDIIEKSDFKAPEKVQTRNFEHFIKFLNKNNLSHIYNEQQVSDVVPLEEKISKLELQPPLTPVTGCNNSDLLLRLQKIQQLLEKENSEKANKIKGIKRNKDKTIKEIKMEEDERRLIIEKKFRKKEGILQKELMKKEETIKRLRGILNRKSVRLTLATTNKLKFK
ncbi:polysaccharide pyruvyl transferase family protein [Pseudogracilibacillus sp. SE30717A]|uniref:polysaccharide pyruvyl transferase family protein n=1 Tax=Pseudogracilibacillus sp. SE30717A TaxID=3098293 RepID=UPI00300DCFCC